MLKDDIDTLLPLAQISLADPPADKWAAIEHLLDLIADNGRVTDREAALEALREREAEATPHAKTAAVTRPSLAFTRSSEGIDFDAMDDEPAHLLFMILVPADGGEEHLGILSALSRALMHDGVRETLRSAETESTVQDAVREAVN